MSDPQIESAANGTENGNESRRTLTIKRSAEALELRERLQKVLATSGLGARRGMEERILKGEITLNGAVPELGAQVKVGDRIGVDDRSFVVKMQEGDFGRILLYNKPDGEVTTRHDPEGRRTVFENLPRLRGSRWIAVGRLDINTQGLLVFTTNGELAQKLMHPENEFEREYLCRVHGEVTEEMVQNLQNGVQLADGPAAFSLIESMDSAGGSNEWWRVVIKEGRNREVRRLWEAVGLQVSRLKRASFGPFTLPKGLHRGELAELGGEDVEKICLEMGIAQNPAQLIAEDEAAGRLRRNRPSGEGEGKKRFVAATKSKAEAFWTGERGYGGAGARPARSSNGEFDLGGSERPRDARPKRGKAAFGKKGPRAAFVGPMGPSSFEQNRDAAAKRPARPRLRSDHRGPRDASAPVGADGLRAPNAARFAPRDRPRNPDRGPGRRPARGPGEERVDIGNRIGEAPSRKRPGFIRGALGTAESYDVRNAYADSEDYGNRISGPQPQARQDRGDRRGPGKARKSFLGPMDNSYARFEGNGGLEVDGNSINQPRGFRPPRDPNAVRDPNAPRGPRPPQRFGRGPRPPRDPNAVREPRPPRDPNAVREPRPPRDPNAVREPRPPRDPNAVREPRPPRDPNMVREPRPPRDPNAPRPPRDPNAPRNNNRRRHRGPRPPRAPGEAVAQSAPSAPSES